VVIFCVSSLKEVTISLKVRKCSRRLAISPYVRYPFNSESRFSFRTTEVGWTALPPLSRLIFKFWKTKPALNYLKELSWSLIVILSTSEVEVAAPTPWLYLFFANVQKLHGFSRNVPNWIHAVPLCIFENYTESCLVSSHEFWLAARDDCIFSCVASVSAWKKHVR